VLFAINCLPHLSTQIVEELEDRLSDRMDDILTLVRESLADSTPGTVETIRAPEEPKDEDAGEEILGELGYPEPEVHVEDWVHDRAMMEFVDTEGAFEGDLDAEEPDE
jgi:hypothetical protein